MTDDNIRGIKTAEQRALGTVGDRVHGLDLQGNDDASEPEDFAQIEPDVAEKVDKALTSVPGPSILGLGEDRCHQLSFPHEPRSRSAHGSCCMKDQYQQR